MSQNDPASFAAVPPPLGEAVPGARLHPLVSQNPTPARLPPRFLISDLGDDIITDLGDPLLGA